MLVCFLGTSELIATHPGIVKDTHVEDPSEPLCRKDVGKSRDCESGVEVTNLL